MSSQRSVSVDLVKFIAAYGVVIIHLSPSTESAELFTRLFIIFVVPFFLLISIYFFIQRVSGLESINLSALRWDRIWVPYLTWTAIYTLMRWIKALLSGESFPLDWVSLIFYGGGAVQLYFMPLLLFFQAWVVAVILLGRKPNHLWVGCVVALGATLFGYWGARNAYFGFEHALEQGVLYCALAFLLGLMQRHPTGRTVNSIVGWLMLPLLLFTAFGFYLPAVIGVWWGPLAGYGVAALALNWRLQLASSKVRLWLSCSYGIYLAHFGFIEVFEFFVGKLGYSLAPYTIASKILLSACICSCCVIFIYLVRLHWVTAYLFIGEKRARI